MPDYERLLGKLEQGMTTISDNQTTMIADFGEHRKEMAAAHAETAMRISETEADVERVETKIDGHSNEDDKRFSTFKWILGGGITLVVAMLGAMQALAQ